MEKVINEIRIKTVKLVETECPVYDIGTCCHRDFNYGRCLSCPFIIDEENAKCGHYEYETDIVREDDYTDDDEYGGMPSTDYCKVIKCANCGSEIAFHSGFSNLVRGDDNKCHKCGLRHVFFRYRDRKIVFSIPIRELDKMK